MSMPQKPPLASLVVACGLLAGCLRPSVQSLLARGEPQAACARLSAGSYKDAADQRAGVAALTRHVARQSDAQATFHLLDADEATRLLGASPPQGSGYGDQVVILRTQVDARRSRVPVSIWVSRGAVPGWTAPIQGEEVDQLALRLVGARGPLPQPAPGNGGDFSLRRFDALGPFAPHTFVLFHLMTGGLTLWERRASPPGEGSEPPPQRRDEGGAWRSFSPYRLPPIPPSVAAWRVHTFTSAGGGGCRAEPNGTCRAYTLLMQDKATRQEPHPRLYLEVRFDAPPGCPVTIYVEPELPSRATPIERLRWLEAAAPLRLIGRLPNTGVGAGEP